MSVASVTLTGATGLIGPQLVAPAGRAGRRDHSAEPRPRAGRLVAGDDVEVVRWDPLAEAAPAAALSGRDAVVHLAGEPVAQRWSGHATARDPRQPGARHAQPRRGPACLRDAAAGAAELLGGRLLRAAQRGAAGRGRPSRPRLPGRGVRRVGARGGRRPRAGCARVHAAHGGRAGRLRRRAGEDAPPLPPRHRRTGRLRAPVHLLDPHRRPARARAERARATSAGAGRSTAPRRRRSRTASSRRCSGASCTGPRCSPFRRSCCGRCTARWPRS